MANDLVTVDETGREIDTWRPDLVKERMAKLKVMSAYAISRTDTELMSKAAIATINEWKKVAAYWYANTLRRGQAGGRREEALVASAVATKEAAAKFGFSRPHIEAAIALVADKETGEIFPQDRLEKSVEKVFHSYLVRAGLVEREISDPTSRTVQESTATEIVDNLEANNTRTKCEEVWMILGVRLGKAKEMGLPAVPPSREVAKEGLKKAREPMPKPTEPDTFETADLGKAGPEFAALNAANYARRAAEKKARDDESF